MKRMLERARHSDASTCESFHCPIGWGRGSNQGESEREDEPEADDRDDKEQEDEGEHEEREPKRSGAPGDKVQNRVPKKCWAMPPSQCEVNPQQELLQIYSKLGKQSTQDKVHFGLHSITG